MRDGTTLLGGNKYERLALGGGGFVTGIRIAGTGSNKVRVVRTDTMGCYIWGPTDTRWRLLLQAEINIDESLMRYSYTRGAGCYDVVVAPSNTNYIYVCQVGYIYRSADRGATWTRTALPVYDNYGANNSYRATNERMNVDPANHLALVLGHPALDSVGGVKYTLDGGDTWSAVSNAVVPPSTTNDRGMSIAFDPDSGTTGGLTNHVYVWSYGNGIYRSTTGITGTFSLISGSPTDIAHMSVRNGILWTAGTTQTGTGQMRKWTSGGGWVDISGLTNSKHVAISPDGTKIAAFTDSSTYYISLNSGTSFNYVNGTPQRVAVNIPWHQTTQENYMSHGGSVWDTEDNTIYTAQGIGCWKSVNPVTANAGTGVWLEDSVGIENLVSMQIVIPPVNSRIHYVCQDRNNFKFEKDEFDVYPTKQGVANIDAIDHGGCIDYAIGDEDYLFVVHSKHGRGNLSTDGGANWTPVAGIPANVLPTAPQTGSGTSWGGNCAVGNPGNLVWLPTYNAIPSYSLDGGATWTYCQFGGATPPTSGMRWHNQYSYQRLQLIADKQNAGTFYIYHIGNEIHDASSQQFRGFWKSTDGGANFVRQRTGLISNLYGLCAFNCKLRMPPGKSPHLFYTVGDVNADDQFSNIGIFFSSDEGVTWTDFTKTGGVQEPLDFAFGKAAPGASYPAIYAYGGLGGLRGLHRCIDFNPANPTAATWETIGRYPGGDLDNGTILAADMNTFGLCYIGFGGSGAFRGVYDYKLRAS